ncbi:Patatin domain-containing protein [Rhizoctonia solani AG-1 IA]|uniref:Patatin domain-containing protein n=1 Tax=Thanatephorus cucumeris (strain AG1-IA) TaxID=983506 RepID=L8X855_THACA|nr:Patatin domain-containing protein [Rhizoctonia solani AG-1 IA]
MRPFLSEEGTEIWYDLRGVLLHRGPSAYHGHYEAQQKMTFDCSRGIWFQFNDEEVRELKIEDLVGKQTSGAPRSQASKDAYMLIYTQRNAPSPDASTLIMPKHAFDAVQRLNKEHTDSCDAYSQRKKEMESEFNLIREQKRQIYQTWQISDVDEVSMVLSKSSLEGWISKELDKATFSRPGYTVKEPSQPTSAIPSTRRSHSSPSPPPPDEIFRVQDASQDASEGRSPFNSTEAHVVDRILCVHGLLDPEASGNMKRIPMSAWKSIQKIGIDAHAIESNRICEDCTAALFNEKFYTIQHDDMVSRFDACMGRDRGTGKEWWISKSWLKDWRLKRPKMHVTGCRDPMPDVSRFRSDLYCEHDCLTPTQKFREKISTSALGILKEAFPEFQPPDTETEICTICEAVAANDKEATREARAKAETRLMALYRREFFGGFKVTRLVEDWTYVILPLSFVTQWRAWLAKPLVAPRPGPITNDDFICEHGGLVIDLAEEKEVDGMICTASVSDWEVISELYGGGPYIECSLLKPDDHTGELRLQSNPPLCQDCRKTRLSNYDDAKINIYRLVDGEPLPDVNEAAKEPAQEKTQVTNSDVIHIDDTDAESPTLSDSSPPARAPGNRKRPKPVTTYAGQRRSKRIRTATTPKKGKTFFIHVNKDDTIRDVKRKIQDAEDIAPFYQQLYLHGVELIDDTRTLLQTGVLRTDCLVLRAIEAMDEDEAINWALTSGDVEPKTVRSRDEGRAFGGTLLGNTYVAPVGTTPSTEQCISATTATTAGTAITTSLPALNGTPGPSPTKGNDNTEDQDMLSVPSTVSDGNIDLDSRLAQELASEDTDPSFLFLEDDAGAAGSLELVVAYYKVRYLALVSGYSRLVRITHRHVRIPNATSPPDGGGFRGLSSLYILREIMQRIRRAESRDDLEPWQCFDMIGGTSMGGLIAIMLGRLRMPINVAIERYIQLTEKVLCETKYSWQHGIFKATLFEQAIKEIVRDYSESKDEETRLLDIRPDSCKVFVCAMAAANMRASIPTHFRTFTAYENVSANCKIWEAVRATSAHPIFFKRIKIQDIGLQVNYIGGEIGCNNPTWRVLTEANRIFRGAHLACLVSIGTGQGGAIKVPEPGLKENMIPLGTLDTLKQIATDCETIHSTMGGSRQPQRMHQTIHGDVGKFTACGRDSCSYKKAGTKSVVERGCSVINTPLLYSSSTLLGTLCTR